MKVFLVSLFFVEYGVELANALSKNNNVHLILCRNRVAQTLGKELNVKLAPSVNLTVLPFHSVSNPSIISCTFLMIKSFLRFRPNVVHIQECMNPLNMIFLLFRSCPLITTIHDIKPHPGKQQKSISKKMLLLMRILRRYYYDSVIVHGEALKKQFLELYPRSEKEIHVIPHGSLFSFLPNNTQSVIEEEPYTILFFGRMQKYKGLKYLIEAEPNVSKQIKDFKIIVAGQGDEIDLYKSKLQSNRHFEVHDRFIPNHEVNIYFQKAAAVVMPYIEASQSGIAAMAFAFGKPVITTDMGSLSEMIMNGHTGLIIPSCDAHALSGAILEMLTNQKARLQMAENARKASLTQFGWELIAEITKRAYDSAISLKRREMEKICTRK